MPSRRGAEPLPADVVEFLVTDERIRIVPSDDVLRSAQSADAPAAAR